MARGSYHTMLGRGVRMSENLGTRPLLSRPNASPRSPFPSSVPNNGSTSPLFCSDFHFTCPYLYQHPRYNTQCPMLTQYTCLCGGRIQGHSQRPSMLHVDTCIWNRQVEHVCLGILSLPWMPCPVPSWPARGSAAGRSDRIRMIDLQPLVPLPMGPASACHSHSQFRTWGRRAV